MKSPADDLAWLQTWAGCSWIEQLNHASAGAAAQRRHGDDARRQRLIESLPNVTADHIELSNPRVTATLHGGVPVGLRNGIETVFAALIPWRKGPFFMMDVWLDSEWRCDLKWQRAAAAMQPLAGRRVLDVGCGNGYYLWRMLGSGAVAVVGIDPTALYLYQFAVIRHFMPPQPLMMLPLTLEELPAAQLFDTVFSMGVLYHRRDPLDHLRRLFDQLRPGGELVLESLIIAGDAGVLQPNGRYAQMKNVWQLPTVPVLLAWLQAAGFVRARLAHVASTTVQEQRTTAWSPGPSLIDFLDADDPAKTYEGHPAPLRAIVIAERPGAVE